MIVVVCVEASFSIPAVSMILGGVGMEECRWGGALIAMSAFRRDWTHSSSVVDRGGYNDDSGRRR